MIHVAPQKKLYVPAVSILAIVVILLVLTGISTYRNLNRHSSMAMAFVHRQGLSILDAVEAGARAGMAMPMWREDSIQRLINEVGSNADIAYLYMIDEKGVIAHHSNPSIFERLRLDPIDPSAGGALHSTVHVLNNGEKIYELSKLFVSSSTHGDHKMMRRMAAGQSDRSAREYIVLGLKMDYFQAARKSDIHHAMMMAGIVIALGSAAIFFIFIIQNYYLVDKTLKQTQDFTSQIISSLSTGVISIDRKTNITAFNDRAMKLLNIDDRHYKSVSLSKILDFESIGIDHTLASGMSILDRELNYSFNGSKTTPLALSVTPLIIENDDLEGAVIQIRDISEIKKLEERVRRSEKLAAVGELAAGVAHEIRNPLSSIRGFTQYLSRGFRSGSSEKEYTDIVIKEIDRINNVVSGLICFANPMEPDLRPTDINKIIHHTRKLVQAEAETQAIAIHVKLDKDAPALLLDGELITQAILNILLNAVQAIGSNGRIDISTRLSKDGEALRLCVEDDGPGIDAGAIGRIFDPYFTTSEHGTGLGLPIVHKIVENHNGALHIDSPVPGRSSGCRITIQLPVGQTEKQSQRAEGPGRDEKGQHHDT